MGKTCSTGTAETGASSGDNVRVSSMPVAEAFWDVMQEFRTCCRRGKSHLLLEVCATLFLMLTPLFAVTYQQWVSQPSSFAFLYFTSIVTLATSFAVAWKVLIAGIQTARDGSSTRSGLALKSAGALWSYFASSWLILGVFTVLNVSQISALWDDAILSSLVLATTVVFALLVMTSLPVYFLLMSSFRILRPTAYCTAGNTDQVLRFVLHVAMTISIAFYEQTAAPFAASCIAGGLIVLAHQASKLQYRTMNTNLIFTFVGASTVGMGIYVGFVPSDAAFIAALLALLFVMPCLPTFLVWRRLLVSHGPIGSRNRVYDSSSVDESAECSPRSASTAAQLPAVEYLQKGNFADDMEKGNCSKSPMSGTGKQEQFPDRLLRESILLPGVSEMESAELFMRIFCGNMQRLMNMHTTAYDEELPVLLEDMSTALSRALEMWPRDAELQLFHLTFFVECGVLTSNARWLSRATTSSGTELFENAGKILKFNHYCLVVEKQKNMCSLSGASFESKLLQKRLKRINGLRAAILSLQTQFWKTLLVDSSNIAMLSQLSSLMGKLDAEVWKIWANLDRIFGSSADLLRAKAEYAGEVNGNHPLAHEMFMRAEQIEDHTYKANRQWNGARQDSVDEEFVSTSPGAEMSAPSTRHSSVAQHEILGHSSDTIPPVRRESIQFSEKSYSHVLEVRTEELPASRKVVSRKSALRPSLGEMSSVQGSECGDACDAGSESDADPDEASSSAGSAQARYARLKQVRQEFLSRQSAYLSKMQHMMIIAIVISLFVFLGFYLMTILVVRPPVTEIDSVTGEPLSTDSNSLTFAFDNANKLKVPLSSAPGQARIWLDKLATDSNRASLGAFTNTMTSNFLRYLDRLNRKRASSQYALEVMSRESNTIVFAGETGITYQSWNTSARAVRNEDVLQLTAVQLTRMRDCVSAAKNYALTRNSTTGLNTVIPTPTVTCQEGFLFLSYNGNTALWNALSEITDVYRAELDESCYSILWILLSVSCAVVIIMILILFTVLFPGITKAEHERDGMIKMLAGLDKSTLKKMHDDAKTRYRHQKHSLSNSMPSTSLSSNGSKSRPRLLFGLAIASMLLYMCGFVVLMAVYLNDLFRLQEEIRFFPVIESSARRANELCLELISPSLSPYGTEDQLRDILRERISALLQGWSDLTSTRTSHGVMTGISRLSDGVRSAVLSPTCTPYNSNATLFDCRSLDEVISTLASDFDYYASSTRSSVFKITASAYTRIYTAVREVLPTKMNNLQNAWVQYYNPRSRTFNLIANVLFACSFVIFPLILYFGLYIPLSTLKRTHQQLKVMFLLIPFELSEQDDRVWSYVSGSETDEVALGLQSSSRQRQASTKAKQSESAESVETVLDTLPDGYFCINEKGIIVSVNSQACILCAKAREALIGLPFEELLEESSFIRSLIHGRQKGKFTFEANCIVQQKGQEVHVPVRVVASCGSSSEDEKENSKDTSRQQLKNHNIVLFVRDITSEKLQNALLEQEKQKSTSILKNILPLPVASRLMRNERPIAYKHESVCTMFCDIVGFTSLAGTADATALVSLLDGIFSEIDEICERHGVTKVKTIGDCVFLCSGLIIDGVSIDPGHTSDGASASRNIVGDMIEASIRIIEVFRCRNLQCRIGINVGPVISGVIGKVKFAYDLWSDSVNVASRMESTGLPMRIQISRSAYQMVYHMYEFDAREVGVKGKGSMEAFLLIDRKNDQPVDNKLE
eukprot:ANDGO_04202.mRNA.1 Adenylate cyclase